MAIDMFIHCSQKQHFNHLMNLSKIIDWNSSRYDRYLCIGNFNSETSETALRNFCDLYKLKHLVRVPTCYKIPNNHFLDNVAKIFENVFD